MEENIKNDIVEDTTMDEQINGNREAATPSKPKKKCGLRWLYAVLSLVALAVILWFGAKPAYVNYKAGQLVAQNYSPWAPDDYDDGGVEASEDKIEELSELFANVGSGKDLKMTIYRLEKAFKMVNYDYEYFIYSEDIAWYLALAYIQQNQFGSARAMLKWLMTQGTEYTDQAKELYKQIENIFFM